MKLLTPGQSRSVIWWVRRPCPKSGEFFSIYSESGCSTTSATAPPAPGTPGKVVATPNAKKLAKQHKVDLNKLIWSGQSGPFGRITSEDEERAAGITPAPKSNVAAVSEVVPAVASAAAPPKASSSFPEIPGSNVVAFSSMEVSVSKNMVESLRVPTFRIGYPIITDTLDALYEKVKQKGVTMSALLAKATAMALVQHPVVNATCKDSKSFTYNSGINIAVAVAINGGLITPVLHDVDKLDPYMLSQNWKELVDKARAKQLQPHEYNSGRPNSRILLLSMLCGLLSPSLLLHLKKTSKLFEYRIHI